MKIRMKKYFSLNNSIVTMLFGAALATMSSAQAQNPSQLDAERRYSGSTADESRAVTSSEGLPRIINARSEPRQAPATVATRPSKTSERADGAFELFVATVTGRPLAVFGTSLFTDVPSTFAPFDGAQVNADYVIGTGDELQIRGWGMIDIDISVTVDRSGAVYIPRVGSVRVAGVKYGDLQSYLKKSISKIYSNFELSASVAQTRAVQVYVVGHAVRPGTYTLNAMSTLLNALFTSGGPDATGSMRNIQLKRGNQTVTSFDLYDMLVNGDKSRDVALRDGDVIFIPEVGPLVALTGNVKQPAIFELRGETSMAEVVRWAGGFDSAAENKRVIVERNVDNRFTTIADFDAEKSALARTLGSIPVRATDVLRVFSPSAVPVQIAIQSEYVRVSGEVVKSGVFQIRTGETLRDLIMRMGGATENGFVFATQLQRDSVRVTQQLRLNEIADRFDRDLEAATSLRLRGTTDRDNAEFVTAELERQRSVARRLRSIKAEGRIALEMENDDALVRDLPPIALQDGDTIHIPRRPGTVDVVGAVFQPSAFAFRPRRTIKDYVGLAGGITANGDKSEMYVIRADGTARSSRNAGWYRGVGGFESNLGDTIVVPEKIDKRSWLQNFKEWTTIFYQFGLGAAGLKVLQN